MQTLIGKVRGWIYKTFIAGLLVWLPIWATYTVVKFLLHLSDNALNLLPHHYQPEQMLGFSIPGLGLVFTIVIFILTGIIATNVIGRHLVSWWDSLVNRIPLIRSIYSAVKNVLHSLVQPNERAFRKVLLVEYPRRGAWSIAFLTSNSFVEPPLDEPMYTVFIPTTPNPTSGFLVVVPQKDTIELNMNVEAALRVVISLGVVSPGTVPHKNQPNNGMSPKPL